MARTTPALVASIIDTQAGTDLTPFIDSASQLVTDVCLYAAKAGNPNVPYSATKLELIERWLAAHFYAIFDTRLSRAKAGTVAVQYQYKVALNLQVTLYGQQAMLLDTEGGLAALNNNIATRRNVKVGIAWLGTTRGPCVPDTVIDSKGNVVE
jgi:hypothetical protein